MSLFDKRDEYPLIERILSATTSADERKKLVEQLERMPVYLYPFYHRWLLVHDVAPFESWDESGFHPERSRFPRGAQILWATSYGIADINNGGLHQFLYNGTGNFAPEICECLHLLELDATAKIIRNAMRFFGDDYPRSQKARQQILDEIPGETREEADPFYLMDDDFYDSLKPDPKFDEAADEFLRNKLGKTSLAEK